MNSRNSGGTENNSELSLVGEYIKLFAVAEHNKPHKKKVVVCKDDDDAGGGGGEEEEEIPTISSRDYWVHDKWNDDELNRAKKTLEDNLEKCWISALDRKNNNNNNNNKSSSSGRIDKNDDDDGYVWDRFYSNHGTRFFKDRHYLERAFPEDFYYEGGNDAPAAEEEKKRMTLVEIGCGVGNAILPMMDDDRQLVENIVNDNKKKIRWDVIHGLDISQEAIALMKKDLRFLNAHSIQRAFGHVCDITQAVPQPCIGSADVTTLLFCLSAIDPDDMPDAAGNVASILKRGGTLLFRDYGRYDEAQMKLGVSRGKCLKENFYRKHDGTKCYYFTLEDLEKLFTDAGLRVLELEYLQRVYDNLKSGEKRRRVWVHARFVKP